MTQRAPHIAAAPMPAWLAWGSAVACRHEWGGLRLPQWRSLRPYWRWLHEVAATRDAQKRSFASSRYWNNNSHFVGLCGEWVYAIETGQEVDAELRISGDGGSDFGGVDVKTCLYWRDAYLKHPANARHWPAWFALVLLDVDAQCGMFVGVVAQAVVRSAPIRDWGHGPQHSLAARACRNIVPDTICRRCGGKRQA